MGTLVLVFGMNKMKVLPFLLLIIFSVVKSKPSQLDSKEANNFLRTKRGEWNRLSSKTNAERVNEKCDPDNWKGPCEYEEVREIYEDSDNGKAAIEKRAREAYYSKRHVCNKHYCEPSNTLRKLEKPFRSCRCLCGPGWGGKHCTIKIIAENDNDQDGIPEHD